MDCMTGIHKPTTPKDDAELQIWRVAYATAFANSEDPAWAQMQRLYCSDRRVFCEHAADNALRAYRLTKKDRSGSV